LRLDGAPQCVDDASELDQHAVAGGLDDAAVVYGNFKVDHLAPERLQAAERPFLVGSDQARIPATSVARIAASRRSTRVGPAGSMAPPCGGDPTPTSARRILSRRGRLEAPPSRLLRFRGWRSGRWWRGRGSRS